MNQDFANLLTHTWSTHWVYQPGSPSVQPRIFASCAGCSLVISDAQIDALVAGPSLMVAKFGCPTCPKENAIDLAAPHDRPLTRFSWEGGVMVQTTYSKIKPRGPQEKTACQKS